MTLPNDITKVILRELKEAKREGSSVNCSLVEKWFSARG